MNTQKKTTWLIYGHLDPIYPRAVKCSWNKCVKLTSGHIAPFIKHMDLVNTSAPAQTLIWHLSSVNQGGSLGGGCNKEIQSIKRQTKRKHHKTLQSYELHAWNTVAHLARVMGAGENWRARQVSWRRLGPVAYSTKFYTERLHSKVLPLTLLYTIFKEKAPLSYTSNWWKVPLSHTFITSPS